MDEVSELLGGCVMQHETSFVRQRRRAVIDPRQGAAEIGLRSFGLLTLGGGEIFLLTVKHDVAIRRHHQIAVLAVNLNGLRANDHIVTRGDAALVVGLSGKRGNGEGYSQ